MRCGRAAVAPAFVLPQEPDIGGEEADGGFDKEVALHIDPAFVDGIQDCPNMIRRQSDGSSREAGSRGLQRWLLAEVVEVDEKNIGSGGGGF